MARERAFSIVSPWLWNVLPRNSHPAPLGGMYSSIEELLILPHELILIVLCGFESIFTHLSQKYYFIWDFFIQPFKLSVGVKKPLERRGRNLINQ